MVVHEPCVIADHFIPRMRKTRQHLFPSQIVRIGRKNSTHHHLLSFSLSNSQTSTPLLYFNPSTTAAAAANPNSHTSPMTEPAQTQTPTQPHHDSTTTTPTPPSPTTTTAASANAPPQNPAPITKIPFRPRKTRKLSPDPNPPSPSSSEKSPRPKPTTKRTKTTPLHPKPLQQQKPIVPAAAARSLSCDGEIDAALRHLRAADPVLSPVISLHRPPTFDSTTHPPFLALAKSILYQQLAYKAGTSIYTRFVSLCGGENGVVPATVLALTPPQLRQIGVSGRKASYLHDLARKYQNGILSDEGIVDLDDKSLFTMLTMVNGIGSWSVHMFMIFSLHRPDVLPINDLGVRKGVQLLYGLEELPRPSQMEQLCEKWRPYRSVGAWYMWRLVEAKGPPQPVSTSGGGAVPAGSTLQLQNQEEEPQQQQQFMDPINGILNIGACAWGQ
ncbi:uncharacterized protein LOC131331028 [Rhododendron vialii]|uniref:uncharacterized protein LOC131331028 n=1 Tax=Rhododendron vialii TaxID=182163 RepID=UPI00265E0AD9|nr:uncharacterized protein LOC131331028 [Rhododendron vialii]